MRLVNLTPLELESFMMVTQLRCGDITTHQNLMIGWWKTLLNSHVTKVLWLGGFVFMVETQPENVN
jgi:hypothetical protein